MPETADDLALQQLWQSYKDSGERALRDQLVLHYSPVVKFVAGRLAAGLPSSVDPADLVSYGIFGLLDAIERFEPARGFKFETYAVNRVRGAILDELRSIDWVPRSVRSRARAVERAFQLLEGQLGRSPSDAELAEALDMTEPQLQAALAQISVLGVAALDETVKGGDRENGMRLGDAVADTGDGPVEAWEKTETRTMLAEAIRGLAERDRLVLSLYYFENLTLAEIGGVIGVSESRVCQIHTKAVLQLRARFAAAGRSHD
jgi:RNA polymerase sigma factor for flagellar operon FliA